MYSFYAFTAEQGSILAKIGKCFKKLSNHNFKWSGFKLFTLNQVIENNLVLLSLVYFVKVSHQRQVIENFAESAQC